ncbi:MAG: hypothetical protein CMJ32_00135 [Phycisphaerae bacterium]|nr:hypothetical protein [Phycisphaerae bacterium]
MTGTIKDLETAAGITDREAFWMQFASIKGATIRDGKLRSNGMEAGIAQLRHMAEQRNAQAA